MNLCVYPGSFDPVTLGHMDLIRRASGIYDRLIVAVGCNIGKKSTFPAETRLRMLRKCCESLENVEVDAFEGLTVQYALSRGARCVLRGLRTVSDFEFEQALALANRHLCPDVETVFLISSPQYSFLSSSVVREMAGYSQDLKGCVPEEIREEILSFFHEKTAGRF